MRYCAHCGSRRVRLSKDSDMLICRDCPGTTIPDKPEYREAASKFRKLLADGYFKAKARAAKEGE